MATRRLREGAQGAAMIGDDVLAAVVALYSSLLDLDRGSSGCFFHMVPFALLCGPWCVGGVCVGGLAVERAWRGKVGEDESRDADDAINGAHGSRGARRGSERRRAAFVGLDMSCCVTARRDRTAFSKLRL